MNASISDIHAFSMLSGVSYLYIACTGSLSRREMLGNVARSELVIGTTLVQSLATLNALAVLSD